MKFGQVEAEIIEVKDSRGHFQFLHFCAIVFPILSVRITLLDFQNSIGHLAILSVIFSKEMNQVSTKKLPKKLIFRKFFVGITQKSDLKLHKNVKTENDPWCL